MFELAVLFGLAMALITGVLVYRDASTRGLTHRTIWSLSIGILSGIGGFLSVQFANRIYFTIRGISYPITEHIAVIRPVDILLTGLLVGLLLSLSTVSVYRISTRFSPAQ